MDRRSHSCRHGTEISRSSCIRTLLAGDAELAIVGECGNGLAAVESIRTERPDLVFLDVQMPDLDGFGVLASLMPEEMPTIVFVTAHDLRASAAEPGCLDYPAVRSWASHPAAGFLQIAGHQPTTDGASVCDDPSDQPHSSDPASAVSVNRSRISTGRAEASRTTKKRLS